MNGRMRLVANIWKSKSTIEGAGVRLERVFGFQDVPDLDPFLLLDDFRSADPAAYLPGFPWHPHRGIETITYMLEGMVEHGDSMGNRGTIGPGDVQWMTAGSGVIHQEMPKGDASNRMGGFQLWANLPARNKMMAPRYRDVNAATIPTKALAGGGTCKIICGTVEGATGPVRDIVIEPEYLDITLPREASFRHEVQRGHTVFAYVVEGTLSAGRRRKERQIGGNHLILFSRDGEAVEVMAGSEGARFLLISGRPLGEPVVWHGPIVMNTDQELQTAFEEYRNGTFIK